MFSEDGLPSIMFSEDGLPLYLLRSFLECVHPKNLTKIGSDCQ